MSAVRKPTPRAQFDDVVAEQVALFDQVRFLRRLRSGEITLADYHTVLCTLFHQTRSGPYTFAAAAVHCPWRHGAAKEYLLRHAEEERTHWRWVLDDLAATGYAGPSPLERLPHPSCEAYIAVNERIAREMPIARLAIACVLEGIGATYGTRYGKLLLETLQMAPEQASFFVSHGQTDIAHTQDLATVLDECELLPEEWRWMCHAAEVAGGLYRAMYELKGAP